MKTILVTTDFSPAASNAANYAADMAIEINANILLFHVYQIPVTYLEAPMAMNEGDYLQDVGKEIILLKEKLVLRTAAKIRIEAEVRMGSFFSELERIAEEVKPYVVVMGSQGTTAAERLFFGGHIVYTMKHLKWPVIALPEKTEFSPVKKIGLACDFHTIMTKTPISELKAFVNDFKSALYLVNSGKKEVFDPEIYFESESLMERLAPVIPICNFITGKDPDESIIDFAKKNNIDMLVVLPKNHDLLHKLMHGSHTEKLVLHSQVPVMAIHAT